MSRSKGRRSRTTYYQPQPDDVQQPRVEPIRRGEIIDLGEMGGDERPPLTASFTHFGTRVRVHPDLSEIDVIDFFEAADAIGEDEQKSMGLIKDFVRRAIDPADFDTFWSGVKSHRQTAQEVMDLIFKVIEGVSGNPSSPPSGSSGTPAATMRPLPPAASTPASAKEELRDRYMRQIERFEAMGTGAGVAMAAQVALAAEARGVDVSRDADPLLSVSG